MRHGNFTRRVWLPAVGKAGLTGVHFHDLRHAGNHYTASAGGNMRELMERMGHSTSRAAMIYLHSTDPRQRALADAVDKAARDELRQARKWPPKTAKPAQGDGLSGTRPRARRMKITSLRPGTGPDLRWKVAPRARLERATRRLGGTTTPALCRPATKRHQRAKQPQAVAVRTILLRPGAREDGDRPALVVRGRRLARPRRAQPSYCACCISAGITKDSAGLRQPSSTTRKSCDRLRVIK